MSAEEVRQEIDRVVGECAGAVSLCWEPRPEGVFDSTQAVTYVRAASDRLMSVLDAEADRRVDRMILWNVNKLADLRAQVEAMPKAKVAGVLYAVDDVVARADVLALLGGEPNG